MPEGKATAKLVGIAPAAAEIVAKSFVDQFSNWPKAIGMANGVSWAITQRYRYGEPQWMGAVMAPVDNPWAKSREVPWWIPPLASIINEDYLDVSQYWPWMCWYRRRPMYGDRQANIETTTLKMARALGQVLADWRDSQHRLDFRVPDTPRPPDPVPVRFQYLDTPDDAHVQVRAHIDRKR